MRRVGEPRPERKQIALDAFDHRIELRVYHGRPRQAEPGVQLVDVTACADTWIRFRHARVPSKSPVSPRSPVLV